MLYTVLRTLIVALGCTAAGVAAMHMLQVQRYQIPELRKLLRRYGDRTLRPDVLIAAAVAVIDWYLPILLSLAIQKEEFRESLSRWLALALFAIVACVLFWLRLRLPMKKPFAVTRRMFRLILLVFSINLAGCIILPLLSITPYLLFAGADYIVLAAAVILRPLEDRINAGFYNSARSNLAARKDLIRIGITGSFGKTACKQILKTLLSEKYRVLATPPSFSTAMGVSRVVNEQLKPEHQVFIAEMGAQHRGEIKELAKLVSPKIGMITCVGSAHLDSFGSIEAAAQTKFELIQSLPEDGMAFFGSDASYGDRLYKLCKAEKYRTNIGAEVECYMRAESVETGTSGTRFELICSDGARAWMRTRLLGEYNVRDIALCAAVARKLGMTMDEIARGVEKLKPLRHQLQLASKDGINIIDDSGNALPEGAAEALRVLRDFPGRRILVTAGLTELESDAEDRNFAFGTQVVGCADYVILIGPEQTRALMSGLMSRRFPKSSVRMVQDESDAAALVREIAETGDSVLYEGVWPDGDEAEIVSG